MALPVIFYLLHKTRTTEAVLYHVTIIGILACTVNNHLFTNTKQANLIAKYPSVEKNTKINQRRA
jgi:hypothetical protein